VKSKKKIAEWQNNETAAKGIQENLKSRKQYKGTDLGQSYLSGGLALAPELTPNTAESLIPCIIASFCADCGISFEPDNLAQSCPSRYTIVSIMEDYGAIVVNEFRSDLEGVGDIFIACDKGNS
jgi:hypothetical protein